MTRKKKSSKMTKKLINLIGRYQVNFDKYSKLFYLKDGETSIEIVPNDTQIKQIKEVQKSIIRCYDAVFNDTLDWYSLYGTIFDFCRFARKVRCGVYPELVDNKLYMTCASKSILRHEILGYMEAMSSLNNPDYESYFLDVYKTGKKRPPIFISSIQKIPGGINELENLIGQNIPIPRLYYGTVNQSEVDDDFDPDNGYIVVNKKERSIFTREFGYLDVAKFGRDSMIGFDDFSTGQVIRNVRLDELYDEETNTSRYFIEFSRPSVIDEKCSFAFIDSSNFNDDGLGMDFIVSVIGLEFPNRTSFGHNKLHAEV